MLNVTFAGDIFDSVEDQYVGDEVAYQALYYSSGLIKWDDVHFSELGKYNINLGDGDWLTQEGGYSTGDKVIICFWTNKSKVRTDIDLTEWSFIEIDLDGSSLYVNDAQTLPFQNPSCSFTTFDNIILDNIGTSNDQEWVFHGVNQYQEFERYGQTIFSLMSFDVDAVDIDWGDGNLENDSLEDDYHHEYSLAGDYHITVKVTNRGSLYCQSEFDVQATYNINNGLTWNIPTWLNTLTHFEPTITGDVDEITKVEYIFDGNIIFTTTTYTDSFDYTFTTSGPHVVTQRITYDNIFEIATQEQPYTLYFDSIVDFIKGEGTCGPNFIDNSLVGNGSITEYFWSIKYGGDVIASYTSSTHTQWEYSWPYTGLFTVIHKIKDSDGHQFGIEKTYDVTQCPGDKTTEFVGGGGGYTETVYVEKEFPKLKVKKLKEIDEHNININIKLM